MPANPPLKPADAVPSPTPSHSLAEFYAAGFTRIQQEFDSAGDGKAAFTERSALVDAAVAQLYGEFVSEESRAPEDLCVIALGGYGRQELFPFSDVDLLFLFDDDRVKDSHREGVAAVSRALWDLRLRVGLAVRPLQECGELRRDNLEFPISLLDSRYLAGDPALFARLRDRVIPRLITGEREDLIRDLVEMTRRRHEEYGNTIFHLEPNLKEAPGGLRDFHVARWLTRISALAEQIPKAALDEGGIPSLPAENVRAFEFLSAARCFVHYRQGRDDNHLTYELQEEAAPRGIGLVPGKALPSAEWMQYYFRHARAIDRLTSQLLEDARPRRSSLYGRFQDWRARNSSADFSVVGGRVFPQRPVVQNPDPYRVLGLFELIARQGVYPSREAERWVEQSLPEFAARESRLPGLWPRFRQILVLPHAALALRAMHRMGLLVALFPEFHAIDSLVIRDFYHRYTVDEHSLMTIQNLKTLGAEEKPWQRSFYEILSELEQPELLFLALLFHDVGKGMPQPKHVDGSLEALEAVMTRLDLDLAERDSVGFLVAQHLEMSATLQRRDVFDPETVRAFAEKVGTTERLKMLCLFTYTDIKSVNPEALTPWKAEMLWQLYVATSNYLTHSLDEDRLHVSPGEAGQFERIRALPRPAATSQELSAFLEGFPKRYLRSHSPEEIASHFELARGLERDPFQVSLRGREHSFELTVVTADRPRLFASITGTLAAWGMNILKADAFSNARGTVLDTFRFVDLFRTLELNPSEIPRLKRTLASVLAGEQDLRALMSGRVNSQMLTQTKVKIPTQVLFDDSSSTHSTLLELIAQDHPGLLYQVSSTLAKLACNIEVALIDTEGQKVIDVFYLTCQNSKLDRETQRAIRDALLKKLDEASTL
jgi:[protein-PII] uridylyltransferase